MSNNRTKEKPTNQTGSKPAPLEMGSNSTFEVRKKFEKLSKLDLDDRQIQNLFRKAALEVLHAAGIGTAVRSTDGSWDLPTQNCIGRLPRRNDISTKFATVCNQALQSNSIEVRKFLGLQAIFAPIHIDGAGAEILLAVVESEQVPTSIELLEIIAHYYQAWTKASRLRKHKWQLASLAAVVDLITKVVAQPSTREASQTLVNELVRYLQCGPVAVAKKVGRKLTVQAISGEGAIENKGQTRQLFETALSESLLRREVLHWPGIGDGDNHLVTAHKQLVTELRQESAISVPLALPGVEPVGALIITGDRNLIQGGRLSSFVEAVAPRLAVGLDAVKRAEATWLVRMLRRVERQFHDVKSLIWQGLFVVVLGALLVPVPYRVRCNCELKPQKSRHSVAPYDGIVDKGFVRAGDTVRKGDLLATMDGSSLRFELASIEADLFRTQKKREVELSQRNVPESMLAEFEAESLAAKKALLEFRQENIEIRSQIDGIVLSGSKDESEGTAVKTGDLLFKVGALEELVLQIAIPASEASHVKVGQTVRVWIDGFEDESSLAAISRLSPQSELRDAKNVVIAEVELENEQLRFRPGMKGRVRVDCDKQALGWNLFHKPWNYLKSRMVWW